MLIAALACFAVGCIFSDKIGNVAKNLKNDVEVKPDTPTRRFVDAAADMTK